MLKYKEVFYIFDSNNNFNPNLMKKIKLLLTILTISSLAFTSCFSTQTLPNKKQIDKRLIGTWQGNEKDQQVYGTEKQWTMNRNGDGTFSLNFKTIENGETDEFVETGIWWVEGNKFFEYHEESGKTDNYKFTIINKEQVKFEMIDTNIEFAESNYTFIDTKVPSSNTEKLKNDGLTLETAIKVKSVDEEYAYVRENCKNCKLLNQSLIEHKGKYFDKISLTNSEGSNVSYFFDINSFYNKIW